jgi:integrase
MLTTKKFLSEKEDAELSSRITLINDRDALIFLLLRKYGMRQGELLAVRLCDLSGHDKTVLIRGTKGSRDREFPLSTEHFQKLLTQAEKVCDSPEDRVFPISRQRLYQLWQKIRPRGKKLHSLRHTAAVGLYKCTKDVQLVQKILGHKSPYSTTVYQDFFVNRSEFKKVFDV